MSEAANIYHPGKQPVPRNAWYVVAFSSELTEKPISRRLLGERVALYRTAGGKPVALADYCAHRAMMLSAGRVVKDDRLQCPYHGLEFDPTGACAHIPSQVTVPPQMKVRSYPTAERWQWVWAWMGDPTLADESLIPDHRDFGLDDGSYYKIARFNMPINGSYQLLHENLLDVSHITFLHEGSFDSGGIASTPAKTEIDGRRIRITREITEVVRGSYAAIFGLADGTKVRRTLRSETWVPSLNVVTNIFEFPDEPGRPAACRHAPFAITPETMTSCHYFVASASNYGIEPKGEALTAQNKSVWDVFLTDKAAIEAIQQSYDELGRAAPDCSVRADEAALRFRRVLNQMIKQEMAV